MGVTEKLASFVAGTSFNDIPAEAVASAKRATLDCLGVILAAVNDPLGKTIIRYVKEKGCAPEAGVAGAGFKTSAEMAALANGTLSHALDFDDTGLSAGHPSVCIVPTGLSFGEKLKSSGKRVLEALIVGYEIESKIGAASGYSQADKGIHATALFGTIGAAAVAAKLLNLDTDQVRTAFGIAGSQVAGLLKNSGTMTKPLHAGNACRAGIMSALLAREGFSAELDIIEAPLGYWNTFISKEGPDEKKVTGKLGNPFNIVAGFAVKKYPCCMLNHRALDAILQLIRENNISHEQVDAVIVGVPRDIFPLRPDANTGFEGKFCLQYNMAAALVDKKIKLETFTDEMVQRPVIRDVMSRVQLQVREDIPIYSGSVLPFRAGNPVAIRLKDGRVLENQVNVPRGSPEAPLTIEELSDKYRDCAKGVLLHDRLEHSIDLLLNLEKTKDIGELMRAVT